MADPVSTGRPGANFSKKLCSATANLGIFGSDRWRCCGAGFKVAFLSPGLAVSSGWFPSGVSTNVFTVQLQKRFEAWGGVPRVLECFTVLGRSFGNDWHILKQLDATRDLKACWNIPAVGLPARLILKYFSCRVTSTDGFWAGRVAGASPRADAQCDWRESGNLQSSDVAGGELQDRNKGKMW